MARTRRHARKNRGSRKGKPTTRHHHRRSHKTRRGGSADEAKAAARDSMVHAKHTFVLAKQAVKRFGDVFRHGLSGLRHAI